MIIPFQSMALNGYWFSRWNIYSLCLGRIICDEFSESPARRSGSNLMSFVSDPGKDTDASI